MNWESLIGELRSAGWTQVRIAERVGCSQPTISEIASGSVGRRGPSFQIASALIELHREVCGAAQPPAAESRKAERAA